MENKTFILKVHYDDFQYKTLVITPETNSKSVCALLASKLYLQRFTFRLFVLKNKEELHSIPESESVSKFIKHILENSKSQPEIRLLVLRPVPTGTNLKMRVNVMKRWLNYQLKGKNHEITNLKVDLQDGIVLCDLAENLSEGNKKIESKSIKNALDLFEEIGISLPHDAPQQVSYFLHLF